MYSRLATALPISPALFITTTSWFNDLVLSVMNTSPFFCYIGHPRIYNQEKSLKYKKKLVILIIITNFNKIVTNY